MDKIVASYTLRHKVWSPAFVFGLVLSLALFVNLVLGGTEVQAAPAGRAADVVPADFDASDLPLSEFINSLCQNTGLACDVILDTGSGKAVPQITVEGGGLSAGSILEAGLEQAPDYIALPMPHDRFCVVPRSLVDENSSFLLASLDGFVVQDMPFRQAFDLLLKQVHERTKVGFMFVYHMPVHSQPGLNIPERHVSYSATDTTVLEALEGFFAAVGEDVIFKMSGSEDFYSISPGQTLLGNIRTASLVLAESKFGDAAIEAFEEAYDSAPFAAFKANVSLRIAGLQLEKGSAGSESALSDASERYSHLVYDRILGFFRSDDALWGLVQCQIAAGKEDEARKSIESVLKSDGSYYDHRWAAALLIDVNVGNELSEQSLDTMRQMRTNTLPDNEFFQTYLEERIKQWESALDAETAHPDAGTDEHLVVEQLVGSADK